VPQRVVAHTVIAQQFKSVQRLHAFADDVTDVVTNKQVVSDGDAEHLDGSHAANVQYGWRQIVGYLYYSFTQQCIFSLFSYREQPS